jgi:hypothetical protein
MSASSTSNSLGRFHRFGVGCCALFVAANTPAFACDAMMVETPTEVRIDYDPFEPSRSLAPTSFVIESRESGPCFIDIAIIGQDGRSLDETMVAESGVRIRFQPSISDTPLTPTGTVGVWRAEVKPATRHRITLDTIVVHDSVASAGDHSDRLTLELREVGALSPLRAPTPLPLKLTSKPRAQMNIAGASGTFGQGGTISRVDFGELSTDMVKHTFLQVRANTQARLSISSENSGFLKLDGRLNYADRISYRAFLSGKEVDLSQLAQVILDVPLTISGTSLPFDLQIGEVKANTAGTYTDNLTINISPL